MSVARAGANGDVSRPSLPAQQPLRFPRPSLSPHNAKAKFQPTAQERAWNSSNLGLRLAADASAAGTASVLVSPIISVIDRYGAPPLHPPYPQPTPLTTTQLHRCKSLNRRQPHNLPPKLPRPRPLTPSRLPRIQTLPAHIFSLLQHLLHRQQYRYLHCNSPVSPGQ
jgi:hypothetical protein